MKLKLVYKEIRYLEYLIDLNDGYDWENLSEKEKELLGRLRELNTSQRG